MKMDKYKKEEIFFFYVFIFRAQMVTMSPNKPGNSFNNI